MIGESLTTVFLLAVIVEVVTNGIKAAFPALKGNRSRIVAAVIGIIICYSSAIGILSNLNIKVNHEFIDYLITGIIISRGSSAIHDITSVFNKKTKII